MSTMPRSDMSAPDGLRAEEKELALFGGAKVRTDPMPPRKAFGDDEIASLMEAVEYYRDSPEDPPYQGKFEQAFCDAYVDMMGGGYADAVATGTGSVFVALEALRPPKDSEVILSPIVDAGPFNCIVYQSCVPVIADVAPGSYNVGVEQFLEKITDKTSVVIAVHSAGEALEIDRLVSELHSRGVKVLEDCSQAPGATFKGRRVGTFGDIAATSTMYRKSLMAGGSGGIVYCRDLDLHRHALACADRGKQVWSEDYDIRSPSGHKFAALNWNTDELSCAIGLASVRRLEDAVARRMKFVRELTDELKRTSKVCRAYDLPEGSSPFFLPIWVDVERISCNKVAFATALRAEGIDLNPNYNFLVCDWEWARPYVPRGIHTPEAVVTRDHSFNLFLNENYGAQEVSDVIDAILKLEAVYA